MPTTTSIPPSSSPSASVVGVLAHLDDNQQRRASESESAKAATSTASAHLSTPAVKKHKSVKSITRDYEFQQTTAAAAASTPTLLSPSYTSSDASVDGKGLSPSSLGLLTQSRRGSYESSGVPAQTSNTTFHSRRASVLLASASYPSTLSTADTDQAGRPRTTSSSSIAAKDQNRSPSLKLASAAYPSSYQTYIKSSRSNGETGPAPLPTMASADILGPPAANTSFGATLPMLNVPIMEDDIHQQNASADSGEEEDMVAELSASPSSKVASSQMTAAERREHSRKHSRVHSRNLSVFFPRPGTMAETEADNAQAANQFTRPRVMVQTQHLPSAEEEGLQLPSSSSGVSVSPSKSNRGHHRKHSVNHALLATSRNSANKAAGSVSTISGSSIEPYEEEKVMRGSLEQTLSTPAWQATALTSLPASYRPLLVFGVMHFILGATLWTKGQSGDSLSLTGLGYLVVFDAFGILNGVASEWLAHDWKHKSQSKQSIRKPYGPHRVETVLQFSQTIFLLFASIYVCKESVEHALLEGAEEHHDEDDNGLVLPWLLLALTTAACLFSNMVLRTHDKLVAACGIATSASDTGAKSRRAARGHGRANSILVDASTLAGPFVHLFSNPFSITVLFFCLTLTSAAIVMPPFQVAALDKVLAGLESVAMLYIAYPASKALGKILLQTAPKSFNTQNVQLLRSLKTIEEHPLVTYVAPPHLWQLTPPTSAINSSSNGNLLGNQRLAKNASLIATVEVFLKEEATDASVLEVTRWAWTLLAPAVGAGAGLQAGESLRGAIRAGEISVQVSREGQRDRYRKDFDSECQHHHHDHAHDHSHHHHDHGHVHQDHSHSHSHAHDHHHSHSHSPSHTHQQSHNGTHTHSHAHDTHSKHTHSH